MQILINHSTYTLAQYYHGVKNGGFEFIRRFFDYPKCLICGAYHCYKFLGFYFRPVFDEHGTFFKDFPIARFECLRKGSNLTVPHKTFSLLPYQLIPYCKYSIPFIFKILEMKYINNKSTMKIQELLSKYEDANGYIDLAQSTLFKFKNLIEATINKLLAFEYYPELIKNMLCLKTDNERITYFIKFALSFTCFKLSFKIRGPCTLGYDFFSIGGGHIKNSHFLFGTPSQFRF
ncbi:MAG: hypothetical protein OMM_03757 [Candidatus Magnetoglobus multicellularis str. Araruama]|uniref:Uncharacterized protein n=1 Tax=Candidatus Magnetoglobus multicellularis str. Araruama TaxID=890399 RepID=A0A1V1P4Q0_9BACT|nr:MAG: hypothetical protein OMM_03757 [Candidatus Magnetoglobus multicellularis str. Araruama]